MRISLLKPFAPFWDGLVQTAPVITLTSRLGGSIVPFGVIVVEDGPPHLLLLLSLIILVTFIVPALLKFSIIPVRLPIDVFAPRPSRRRVSIDKALEPVVEAADCFLQEGLPRRCVLPLNPVEWFSAHLTECGAYDYCCKKNERVNFHIPRDWLLKWSGKGRFNDWKLLSLEWQQYSISPISIFFFLEIDVVTWVEW